MSSPPDSGPQRPTDAAVARYRQQTELGIHAENRRWDAALGLVRGLLVGASLGVVLIPLAALIDISSIDVLSVVLATSAAGGGFALRRARAAHPDPPWARLTENVAHQTAIDEHRQRLRAIEAEVETLRQAGVDPREISNRARQQVDSAHSSLCERLAPRPTAATAAVTTGGSTTPAASPTPPTRTPSSSAGRSASLTPGPSIPDDLIKAQRNRTLVPFVGAGLSLGDDVRGNFPAWGGLARRILDAFKPHHWRDDHDRQSTRGLFLEPDPTHPGNEKAITMPLPELLVKLDLLKSRLGGDYSHVLAAIFRPDDATPGEAHRALLALRAPFVLTTNYDQLLEALEGPHLRQAYTWRKASLALSDAQLGRAVLFKVHGNAEDVQESLVLTASEYERARREPGYRLVVDHLLAGHTFLFVGYGMSDPADLDIILRENAAALRRASPHFALLHRTQADTIRRDELRQLYNVVVIPLDDYSQIVPFLQTLASA